MLDLTFLSELSDDELENLACEAKRESENRKKIAQSNYWDKVIYAINDYFGKGYSIKLKLWCDDFIVNSSNWIIEDEIGVLNFEGESQY